MNLYLAFALLPLPVLLTFLFFLLLLLLPFLPGIVELVKPKDALPLFIKMDYFKDPRYFDRAFKRILNGALEKIGFEPGMKQVKLSKNETVEISDSKMVRDGESISHIIYVKKTFTSGKDVRLNKEIFAAEAATIGEKNILRALACDGNVVISNDTKIIRWVGSEGNIKVGSKCILGVFCSCKGKLEINKDCLFKALYGNPVVTYGMQAGGVNPKAETQLKEEAVQPGRAEVRTIEDVAWYASEKDFIISPFTRVDKDIIVKNNLTLKKGCAVKGSLKTYGNIVLEEDVTVDGNIFAEGDIIIGKRCVISGNLFSQNRILIADNARIGREGVVKSIIGKKDIKLNQNTVIFGYMRTEGTGRVL